MKGCDKKDRIVVKAKFSVRGAFEIRLPWKRQDNEPSQAFRHPMLTSAAVSLLMSMIAAFIMPHQNVQDYYASWKTSHRAPATQTASTTTRQLPPGPVGNLQAIAAPDAPSPLTDTLIHSDSVTAVVTRAIPAENSGVIVGAGSPDVQPIFVNDVLGVRMFGSGNRWQGFQGLISSTTIKPAIQ
jgi:hypothetical protein